MLWRRRLDGVEIGVEQGAPFVSILGVFSPEPDHLAYDLYIEACTLGLGVNVLLIVVERPDFFLKVLNPLDNRAKLTTFNSGTSSTHGFLLVNTGRESARSPVITSLRMPWRDSPLFILDKDPMTQINALHRWQALSEFPD
jgi:hypothetical protein